jgi:hypothetical protein
MKIIKAVTFLLVVLVVAVPVFCFGAVFVTIGSVGERLIDLGQWLVEATS